MDDNLIKRDQLGLVPHIIKPDLLKLFEAFENGNMNMARLNYATVILIPKEPNAVNLKKYRPISLLNCSFKIFSKAMNNRLVKLCDRLITSNQSAFIKGRFILENVVAAHELIHEIVRKKECGIIIKLTMKRHMIELTGTSLRKC